MTGELPPFYFRVREAGAVVFRLDPADRQRRLAMEPIATVDVRTGAVRPQGSGIMTAEDRAAIEAWIAGRRAILARREADEVQAAIERLNHLAGRAQARAGDAALDAATDALLLAMHDLREALVRRRAARLDAEPGAGP